MANMWLQTLRSFLGVRKRGSDPAAQRFRVSSRWIRKLLARYRERGLEAVDARSGRPHTSPHATDPRLVENILDLRTQLGQAGLEAEEIIAEHLIDPDRDYQLKM